MQIELIGYQIVQRTDDSDPFQQRFANEMYLRIRPLHERTGPRSVVRHEFEIRICRQQRHRDMPLPPKNLEDMTATLPRKYPGSQWKSW